MIEVEIRGPVAQKEYEKLHQILVSAGEHAYTGYHIMIEYTDRGYNDREVRLECKNGISKIFIRVGKTGSREEVVTELSPDAFSDGVRMLAELGYKKAKVTEQKVFSARYGGALFSLYDPDGAVYYEAVITAGNPTEAKEAKAKLEKLARNFKLPIWTPLHMLEFKRRLHETMVSLYDYDIDGSDYFRKKFQI